MAVFSAVHAMHLLSGLRSLLDMAAHACQPEPAGHAVLQCVLHEAQQAMLLAQPDRSRPAWQALRQPSVLPQTAE